MGNRLISQLIELCKSAAQASQKTTESSAQAWHQTAKSLAQALQEMAQSSVQASQKTAEFLAQALQKTACRQTINHERVAAVLTGHELPPETETMQKVLEILERLDKRVERVENNHPAALNLLASMLLKNGMVTPDDLRQIGLDPEVQAPIYEI